MAFLLPCSHQICKKSDCYYLPVIKDDAQTMLEFSSETKAAIFKAMAFQLLWTGVLTHALSWQTLANLNFTLCPPSDFPLQFTHYRFCLALVSFVFSVIMWFAYCNVAKLMSFAKLTSDGDKSE